MSALPRLEARVPGGGTRDPDEILDRFLGWVTDQGLEPYAEQEEAILELFADRHVVLSTPTGSGKSLVALALHFKGLCEGRRSFYTAPVKALVSEKFFSLCEELGAGNVGMLTGDASVNPEANVVCCTQEVLASMALRGGERTDAPYAVLDEFHYYADRSRGVAWQIPLIALPDTQFLLMSATLGNTAPIESRLRDYSGRPVVHVHSDERPVPLDFEYRETLLHETLEDLVARDLAPVYVVNFTQRECDELAQGLTSAKLTGRERRREIAEQIADFRFDTAYGRDLKRFLGHGIGVHHAGLLPKYRLLVERLAGLGLLVAISGTDTLGVGVNVPIRTVLFTALSKFDGEKVGLLPVREFKQIAGRAGRKGFDVRGAVVCQAPEHVTLNRRLAVKAGETGRKKPVKKKAPRGFVPWNEDVFRKLAADPPEMLVSRFDVSHGMIVSVLQREGDEGGSGEGYRHLVGLIDRCHESEATRARLRRRCAALFRSLRHAGIVDVREAAYGPPEVRVHDDLQTDFSLTGTLSLWLVEAAAALDATSERYPQELLSLVEATQENPRPIIAAQTRRRRDELWQKLKAEGVDHEERIRKVEEVTHDKPEEEFIRASFQLFAQKHPWVREEDVRPKSIAREMFEGYRSFHDTVKDYGIARSEGLLLRYLSQVHNALAKSLPAAARTEEVYDAIAFLRTTLTAVDSSLVEAWETLLAPGQKTPKAVAPPPPFDLAAEERALAARVRAELHGLVRSLAREEYEEALAFIRQDPERPWDAAALAEALAPFFEEYERIVFEPRARQAFHTRIQPSGPRTFDVSQVLVDPAGDDLWAIHGEIDLRDERDPEHPLVCVRRIGP